MDATGGFQKHAYMLMVQTTLEYFFSTVVQTTLKYVKPDQKSISQLQIL